MQTHTKREINTYGHIFWANDGEGDDLLAIILFIKNLYASRHYPEFSLCENAGKYPQYKVTTMKKRFETYLKNHLGPAQKINFYCGSPLSSWCEVTESILLNDTEQQKAKVESKEKISTEAFEATVHFLCNKDNQPRLYIGTSAFHDLITAVKFLRDPDKLITQAKQIGGLELLVQSMEKLKGVIAFTQVFTNEGKFKNIDFAGTGSANFRSVVANIKKPNALYPLTHVDKRSDFFDLILGSFNRVTMYENYHSTRSQNNKDGYNGTEQTWPGFNRFLIDLQQHDDPDVKWMASDLLDYIERWDDFNLSDCITTLTVEMAEALNYQAENLAKTKQLLGELKQKAFQPVPETFPREKLDKMIKDAMGEQVDAVLNDPNKKDICSKFGWNWDPLLSMLSIRPQCCLADFMFSATLVYPKLPNEALVPSKVSFDDSNVFNLNTIVEDQPGNYIFYIRLGNDPGLIEHLGAFVKETLVTPSKEFLLTKTAPAIKFGLGQIPQKQESPEIQGKMEVEDKTFSI